ncbi:MAG: PTS sugar transporter subunit IIC [Absicoccus porci]|jgi:PTS system mannose-specific IIC component|uniref:PTS sugar transporter subunit IIC n=1 Tax=Absicoccus porci TaxID=2486576 RepID=A0A3N0HWK9_9FIRM|nr:PTS sugar transporter subunit IIC [Absicoccus porci]MCI6087740.1 PTS sugar transporter subunit IIC [Absicoccus porci]MDD7329467.1 PTS sugar transporter subunit IIC [Absicoccus porci]MDY4739610.1 PTS sugar transporter subunit IIC [Absicoccus porci]RNM29179.1 PTS sugar transporter subunit IIC [Absicoccus porci]
MTLFQAIIIGILSMLAASTPAMAGTTIGNYTLNRPLVAGLLLGIVFGDLRGCILIAMPMQVMWIALVTPGGTVASDLRAVSYIGIPLAYVGARAAGMDFGGKDAQGLASSISAMTGVIGITLFYLTAMMNLIWQHWGWAQIEKGNIECVGKVDAVLPWITNIVISFIPVTLLCYYGSGAVEEVFNNLNTSVWYVKAILTVGAILPAVGISILLKSVITKNSDLIYFMFGFAMAASMGLTLLAATAIGGVFALIDYKMAMNKIELLNAGAGAGGMDDDDEEDI